MFDHLPCLKNIKHRTLLYYEMFLVGNNLKK